VFKGLFGSSSLDQGLSARHDLSHRFLLTRGHDEEGFQYYTLENTSKREKLVIRRFLFDQFRAAVRDIRSEDAAVEKRVSHGGVDYFVLSPAAQGHYIISQLVNFKDSTGGLRISWGSFKTLDGLLFDQRLAHPNDILELIVDYHKICQFTFEEATESITSDLTLKQGLLCHTEAYVPAVGRSSLDMASTVKEQVVDDLRSEPDANDDAAGGDAGLFRSRLAERSVEKDYAINYEKLFSRENLHSVEVKSGSGERKKKSPGDTGPFQLSLHASEVKNLTNVPFKCELTTDELESMRVRLSKTKNNLLLLGFEMIDAVHRNHGRLRTFRFPLYYMRVKITESGRFIYLQPQDDNAVYLNHVALARLFQQFGRSVGAGDPVRFMFDSLLKQQIELKHRFGRIHLKRALPVGEEVFSKVRDVLLGFPGENGKGGILADLRTIGLECDLESVFLYDAPRLTVPTSAALEEDLDSILALAKDSPERFYDSLLGRFLSHEMRAQSNTKSTSFCERHHFPGAVPKSTKRLLAKLNEHDLVLLEGPPGTGKTFTIMNLFLHCLSTKKRLLIVSDKQGAIHALTEKVQEYLLGRERNSGAAKRLDHLWQAAIKVVDDVPKVGTKLEAWCLKLKQMLQLELAEMDLPQELATDGERKIQQVDKKIEQLKAAIDRIIAEQNPPRGDGKSRVSPKHMHATTQGDVRGLVDFLRFNDYGKRLQQAKRKVSKHEPLHLTKEFIKARRYLSLHEPFASIYGIFALPDRCDANYLSYLVSLENDLAVLKRFKPKSIKAFKRLAANFSHDILARFFFREWENHFPTNVGKVRWFFRTLKSVFFHPSRKVIRKLYDTAKTQRQLLELGADYSQGLWREYQLIDQFFHPRMQSDMPLSLEILQQVGGGNPNRDEPSVQIHLEEIAKLQSQRDALIKENVISCLEDIVRGAYQTSAKSSTNAITTLIAQLDSLAQFHHVEEGLHVLHELQRKLAETFPIWVCRKQDVSFLFPCAEHSFDLVIVDEATQCRVDDALPLLFRAKKLMVVGDEKQTVLDKNSVIDDYLFREFALEEHLRSTQARGIKAGGSNIFSLVKGIKQASVMLDEHYRCPPEIIEFSNRYVYGSELKTMQWVRAGKPPAVYVDYSEAKANAQGPKTSGKYKSIETDMFDRFLQFVEASIIKIEKETGERINVETDVALCYFLLKNEPYAKDVKGEFLTRLKRGQDILDGAGAALQGKERDYVFYYWDVNRGNMGSFRQGDEEDKRKGELNVLMSRPKRRAYHYLSKSFSKLDHRKSSITDYLWRRLNEQSTDSEQDSGLTRRTMRPASEHHPWARTSGQLMGAVINYILQENGLRPVPPAGLQYGVIVGDPNRRVDLMILSKDAKKVDQCSVALVDLAAFSHSPKCVEDLVDFYFQLQRANPKLKPVFAYMHELVNPHASSFLRLERKIGEARQTEDDLAA